jgi:hypothetical protein
MLRLVIMAVVLAYKPQYFEFAHLYFWQVALIVFVLAIVIVWIEKVVGREKALAAKRYFELFKDRRPDEKR